MGGGAGPGALAWYEADARIRNARHVCVHRPPGWADRAESLLTPWPARVPRRRWTRAAGARSG